MSFLDILLLLIAIGQIFIVALLVWLPLYTSASKLSATEIEARIADLGIPKDGAERVRKIREDPAMFEKVKLAARLRIEEPEAPLAVNVLTRAGFASSQQRQIICAWATVLYFGFAVAGGFTGAALIAPAATGALIGCNAGLLISALCCLAALRMRLAWIQREIRQAVPSLIQHLITVLVHGLDIESGLKELARLYQLRLSSGIIVKLLHDVRGDLRESGLVLKALRMRARMIGNDELRRTLSILAQSSEHGSSAVGPLRDLARTLTLQGYYSGYTDLMASCAAMPIQRLLFYAGSAMSALQYRLLQGALSLLALAVALMMGLSAYVAAAACIGAASLPFILFTARIGERTKEFEREFRLFVHQFIAKLRAGLETSIALSETAQYLDPHSLLRIEVENFTAQQAYRRDAALNTELAAQELSLLNFAASFASKAAEHFAISLALSRGVPGKLYHMLEQSVAAIQPSSR